MIERVHRRLGPLLTPLSWLYAAAVARRNRGFDRGEGVVRLPFPVVSVGNLTVGGTGKTPTVALLGQLLIEGGRRPGLIGRGYRGDVGRGPCVVSEGDGARVDASLAGDEPVLLAGRVPGAIVVAGSDRVAGARRALELGADTIVLDDGFQHRRLARDLDIVLVAADAPLDRERLLPAGRLREPTGSLARAHLVLATGLAAGAPLPDWLAEIAGPLPVARAGTRIVGLTRQQRPVETPARAVAFCGIAAPDRFRDALESLGIELLDFHALGDHRTPPLERLLRWSAHAKAEGAELITTEKDAVRVAALQPGLPQAPLVLRIESLLHDPGIVDQALERLAAAASC